MTHEPGDTAGTLGDLVRAMARLAPTGAAVAAVRAMLRPREPRGDVSPAAGRAVPSPRPVQSPEPGDWLGRPLSPPAALPKPPAPAPALAGTTRVTALPPRPLPGPSAENLAAAASLLGPGGGDGPAGEPTLLIAPLRARAVLAALATTRGEGGSVDVDALVRQAALGRPLTRLPWRPVPTLRRGAQLLIDCSAALMPLAHDVEAVEQRLQAVLGRERLQRLFFAGCPGRGVGPGERAGWDDWRAPAPGVPVILVSDLGCAGARGNDEWAGPAEWSRFADRARRAGVPLVALLPYPVQRVPVALARRIRLVPWSERLSASAARHIVRDARTARAW